MRRDTLTVIIGKRKSGKSTLLRGGRSVGRGIVKSAGADLRFVLDPRNEWSKGLRFSSVTGPKGLQAALRAYARGNYDPPFKRWIVQVGHPARISNFFDLLAPNQRRGKPGVPGLLVLDEASEYQTPHDLSGGLRRIINLGGNDEQSVIVVARLWRQLHREIRQNADAVISFRGAATDTIREIGRTIDPGAEKIRDLKRHEFCVLGETRDIDFADYLRSLDSFVQTEEQQWDAT